MSAKFHLIIKPALFFLLGLPLLFSCKAGQKDIKEDIRIAFMADVHFHDVYGQLKNVDHKVLRNPKNGKKVLMRTMGAQLLSTRLFNENYFALFAALDDVVKRGIKLVALPGDFSDDGQALNIRRLNSILNDYHEKSGISFFLTTGNHDPTRPFGKESGKSDFLGSKGKTQPVMSAEGMYSPDLEKELPVIISKAIKELGYEDIINGLNQHGFFPKREYIYWETPFSAYPYEDYAFAKAKKSARIEHRNYLQQPSGRRLPDVSYLVEPTEGLWLLALDANVYLPQKGNIGYEGAGIGYNEVLEHKSHLVEWASKVSGEAKRLGKTLIAFSHYPMVDFNDGASQEMRDLFGRDSFQAYRVPDAKVAAVFADAGIKVHVGGHMHLNDTSILTTTLGNTIVNIQAPSPAAYPPAYKILTLKNGQFIDVETVTLDTVPRFDELFDLYKNEEYAYLAADSSLAKWNVKILNSATYWEYTNWHLKELIKCRFLPNDWPPDLLYPLLHLDGKELMILANAGNGLSKNDLETLVKNGVETIFWKNSLKVINVQLKQEGLNINDFQKWNGEDLILDFYRIRNADDLALKDISKKRMLQYNQLIKSLKLNLNSPLIEPLRKFAIVFEMLLNDAPADHFEIDLNSGHTTAVD